ncbi:pyridoxamine 5'-phosphate oxidase family protein, partial [Candidatus Bathyarchaeota archaeon]
RVCFQVEEVGRFLPGEAPCKFGVEYRSVIAYGRVRFLEEAEEKLEALRLLLRKYGASEAAEALSEEMLGGVLVGEIRVEEMTGRRRLKALK